MKLNTLLVIRNDVEWLKSFEPISYFLHTNVNLMFSLCLEANQNIVILLRAIAPQSADFEVSVQARYIRKRSEDDYLGE